MVVGERTVDDGAGVPQVILEIEAAIDVGRSEAHREYRTFSATRLCWSKGIGGGDAFMKLWVSSSGCKARPAKGEPAQVGSEPGASLRNKAGEA